MAWTLLLNAVYCYSDLRCHQDTFYRLEVARGDVRTDPTLTIDVHRDRLKKRHQFYTFKSNL